MAIYYTLFLLFTKKKNAIGVSNTYYLISVDKLTSLLRHLIHNLNNIVLIRQRYYCVQISVCKRHHIIFSTMLKSLYFTTMLVYSQPLNHRATVPTILKSQERFFVDKCVLKHMIRQRQKLTW